MKKVIMLKCVGNVEVPVEADVAHGIAIHRPVYFEIDEQDNIVLNSDDTPVYELGKFFWRLTHVNSGLSIMHARTKQAAQQARKVLQSVDLDRVASLDKEQRLTYLPDDHELRHMMEDHDTWLPPNWKWR